MVEQRRNDGRERISSTIPNLDVVLCGKGEVGETVG